MLASLKSFGSCLVKHWAWTLVFLFLFATFIAAPFLNLIGKIPFVGDLSVRLRGGS